jgi:hypothetical protein
MRDLVYSEVYTGGTSSSALLSTLENLSSEEKSSTSEHDLKVRINRVSEEFGLSKKRVEAVLKLKEHERGMKERGEVSRDCIIFPPIFFRQSHPQEEPRYLVTSSMMKQIMT